MPPFRPDALSPIAHLHLMGVDTDALNDAAESLGYIFASVRRVAAAALRPESLPTLGDHAALLIALPPGLDGTGASTLAGTINDLAQHIPTVQILLCSPVAVRSPVATVACLHCPSADATEYALKIMGHLARLHHSGLLLANPPEARQAFAPVLYGDNLGQALAAPLSLNQLHLERSGARFDALCHVVPGSKHLVVLGPSLMNRALNPFPYFFRWSWMQDFPFSTLILNDPTLYLDDTLAAGWFVGTPELDVMQLAATLVEEIAGHLSVCRGNIVFAGSSAGGFSAIGMAACLPGSHAFAEIAQFRLRPFSRQEDADAAIQAGLGLSPDQPVPPELAHRVDLVARIRWAGHLPNLYLCPNAHDMTAGHMVEQFGHFMQGYTQILVDMPQARRAQVCIDVVTRRHLLHGGHLALPKQEYRQKLRLCMDRFTSNPVAWNDLDPD